MEEVAKDHEEEANVLAENGYEKEAEVLSSYNQDLRNRMRDQKFPDIPNTPEEVELGEAVVAGIEHDVPMDSVAEINSSFQELSTSYRPTTQSMSYCGDDAVKWAREFCKAYPELKGVDEDTMHGWFANAIEIAHDRRTEKTMLPSETLYGFMAWLTTRPETLMVGAGHDAAPVPPLLDEFCKANNLPDVRAGIYPDNFTMPSRETVEA